MTSYDVVVVGCGGWGLAVLKVLKDMGLHVVGIEREEICQNLRRYMKGMVMHSRLSYLVLDPEDAILAQKGDEHHPLIEELIQSYSDFSVKFNLPTKTHYELIDIQGAKNDFVLTVRNSEDHLYISAKRVVLATGAFDSPNLACIPGELDDAVHHTLHEWEHIQNKNLLFIGGGFSSADGIIALCPHNNILWVVRKSRAEIESILQDQKTIWGQPNATLVNTEILSSSDVLSLTEKIAVVQTPYGRRTWAYDLCFMLIGHKPDGHLCAKLLNHNLAYDEDTFESCERPGIYLVGALAKKHLEHIGLTDKLCPDNKGVRYIEHIRDVMQREFNLRGA